MRAAYYCLLGGGWRNPSESGLTYRGTLTAPLTGEQKRGGTVAGLYLLQDDKKLVEFEEAPYDSEALLQELLEKYPGLLAGDLVDAASPRRWLLVKREAGIPDGEDSGSRWSVDHLYLDQDGIPTLVEVKRSTDTRIRREVVGQMLDYAANSVVYWSVEVMQQQFALTSGAPEIADVKLAGFLGDANPDEFWRKVKANLLAGRIRMLFVADHIPKELKRIIEFLNVQMDPAEVLALEIRQYVHQNLRTFVPTVIGQTSEAQIRKSASQGGSVWSAETFLAELQRRDPKGTKYARRLLDWASAHGTIWWGRGAQHGSFVPMIRSATKEQALLAMYTYGKLELYFKPLSTRAPFNNPEKMQQAIQLVSAALPIPLSGDVANKVPQVRLSDLTEDAFAKLLDALGWMAGAIHSS